MKPMVAPPGISAPIAASPRPGPGRRTPPRLRVFFLRHYRACGEVKRAAELSGVAPSTAYRWRQKDAAFSRRWDSLAEQHRQAKEDRLMQLVDEGEKTAVFYRGRQVGCRVRHTARAAVTLLARLDRREKAKEKARSAGCDRKCERHFVSRSDSRKETEKATNPEVYDSLVLRKTGRDRKSARVDEATPPPWRRRAGAPAIPALPFPSS